MVSLLRYFLCLITVIVAAEAAWGGWRGGAVTSPYYGCVYGYPYCATTIIRLTGGYGYAPNYCYGYGYLYGAGNSGPFSIALDSYDGTYLSISS